MRATLVAAAFHGLVTMAIKERPAVVHCKLGGDVGGTVAMGAELEGGGARPACRTGAREVPDTHAREAAHKIPIVCNLIVEGEAPEAATSSRLRKSTRPAPIRGHQGAYSIAGLEVMSVE